MKSVSINQMFNSLKTTDRSSAYQTDQVQSSLKVLLISLASIMLIASIVPRLAHSKSIKEIETPHLTSSNVLLTPALTLTGQTTFTYFGNVLGTIGDANGDGYADVFIGAEGYNTLTGQVFIYYGSTHGLSSTPSLTLTGEAKNSFFGFWASSAGDINDDGYSDFIVGAFAANGTHGRAYIYMGSPSGLNPTPALTLTGQTNFELLGYSVSTAGDVNGDGYADVIIGGYGYLTSTGRAFVYAGSPIGLAETPMVTLTGESIGDQFGSNVATAGDLNHDGYADVIVSARGYLSHTGRVYVYLGSASGLHSTPSYTFTGEAIGDEYGFAANTIGDVNHDHYSDMAIGADYFYSYTGRAYIYEGNASGLTTTPIMTLTGVVTQDKFGNSIASAGDLNHDGYGDVVIGSYGYLSDTGRAYVYAGSSSGLLLTPIFTATGELHDDAFGRMVAGVGDVNQDGADDLLLGAKHYPGNARIGRAYFFLGVPTNSQIISPTITSSLIATGTIGLPFTYTIGVTGTLPITVSASNLPSWSSLAGSIISGTPDVTTTAHVIITATNSIGFDVKSLTITILNLYEVYLPIVMH
jgi:hypothetical protein